MAQLSRLPAPEYWEASFVKPRAFIHIKVGQHEGYCLGLFETQNIVYLAGVHVLNIIHEIRESLDRQFDS